VIDSGMTPNGSRGMDLSRRLARTHPQDRSVRRVYEHQAWLETGERVESLIAQAPERTLQPLGLDELGMLEAAGEVQRVRCTRCHGDANAGSVHIPPLRPDKMIVAPHPDVLQSGMDVGDQRFKQGRLAVQRRQILRGLASVADRAGVKHWTENTGVQRADGRRGVEELLAQAVNTAVDLKLIDRRELSNVIVDSTVQPKAVEHPTDSRMGSKRHG